MMARTSSISPQTKRRSSMSWIALMSSGPPPGSRRQARIEVVGRLLQQPQRRHRGRGGRCRRPARPRAPSRGSGCGAGGGRPAAARARVRRPRPAPSRRDGIGDRLLDQHRHAALDAREARRHVQRIRRGDDHAVGLLALQHLAVVGVGLLALVSRISDAGELALRLVADGFEVPAAELAGADQPDPHRTSGSCASMNTMAAGRARRRG